MEDSESNKYENNNSFFGDAINNINTENSKSQKDSSNSGNEINKFMNEINILREEQRGESGASNDNSDPLSNEQDYMNYFEKGICFIERKNNMMDSPKAKNNDNINNCIPDKEGSFPENLYKCKEDNLSHSTNTVKKMVETIQSSHLKHTKKHFNLYELNKLPNNKKGQILEKIREQREDNLSKNKSKNNYTNSSSSNEINNTDIKGKVFDNLKKYKKVEKNKEELMNEFDKDKRKANKYAASKINDKTPIEMNQNFISQIHYYSNLNYCINPTVSRNRNNNYYECYTGPDKFHNNSNFKNDFSSSQSNNSYVAPIQTNKNIGYQRKQNPFIFTNPSFTLSNDSRNINYKINPNNNKQNSKYSFLSTSTNSYKNKRYDTLNSNDSGNSYKFVSTLPLYPSRNDFSNIFFKKSNTSFEPNSSRTTSMEKTPELTNIDMENICLGKDTRKTIMIKNIPLNINICVLKEELLHFKGKYDYLYIPPGDTCKNKGYAFINFTSPLHILQFYEYFNGYAWNNFNSDKECKLGYARFQGMKEIIKHTKKYKDIRKPEFYKINEKSNIIEVPCKYLTLILTKFPKIKYKIKKKTRTFIINSFN